MSREPIRQPVDLCSVLRATSYAQTRLSYYQRIIADPNKKERLKAGFCQVCEYTGRVGGAVCTKAQCGLCPEIMHFGSTCVDVLCKQCALDYFLCRHCGGDLHLRNRRKLSKKKS